MLFPFVLKLNYFFSRNSFSIKSLDGRANNLVPCTNSFNKKVNKFIYSAQSNYIFRENVTP